MANDKDQSTGQARINTLQITLWGIQEKIRVLLGAQSAVNNPLIPPQSTREVLEEISASIAGLPGEPGMKIIAQPTAHVTVLNGVECRIWEATTDTGIPVTLWVPLIRVRAEEDQAAFQAELLTKKEPSPETAAIPLRMVI